jgi:hypothetical protein
MITGGQKRTKLAGAGEEEEKKKNKKNSRLPEKIRNAATVGNGVEVRPSTIPGAGNGLFATRRFERLDIVTMYDGELADAADCRADRERDPGSVTHYRSTRHGGVVIKGLRDPLAAQKRGGGSFANHAWVASERNATLETDFLEKPVNGRQHVGYIQATRAILPGEEILIDYGRQYPWHLFTGEKKWEEEGQPQMQHAPPPACIPFDEYYHGNNNDDDDDDDDDGTPFSSGLDAHGQDVQEFIDLLTALRRTNSEAKEKRALEMRQFVDKMVLDARGSVPGARNNDDGDNDDIDRIMQGTGSLYL